MKETISKRLINSLYGKDSIFVVLPKDARLAIWSAKGRCQMLSNTDLRYFDTDSLKGEKK